MQGENKKKRKAIKWERLEIFSRRKKKDTRGIFHAKIGTIKNRNGRDLIEAEDIKKRWKTHRRTIQKGPNDTDNHDVVVAHI